MAALTLRAPNATSLFLFEPSPTTMPNNKKDKRVFIVQVDYVTDSDHNDSEHREYINQGLDHFNFKGKHMLEVLLKKLGFKELDSCMSRTCYAGGTNDDWQRFVETVENCQVPIRRVVRCKDPGLSIVMWYPEDKNTLLRPKHVEEIEFTWDATNKRNVRK